MQCDVERETESESVHVLELFGRNLQRLMKQSPGCDGDQMCYALLHSLAFLHSYRKLESCVGSQRQRALTHSKTVSTYIAWAPTCGAAGECVRARICTVSCARGSSHDYGDDRTSRLMAAPMNDNVCGVRLWIEFGRRRPMAACRTQQARQTGGRVRAVVFPRECIRPSRQSHCRTPAGPTPTCQRERERERKLQP